MMLLDQNGSVRVAGMERGIREDKSKDRGRGEIEKKQEENGYVGER